MKFVIWFYHRNCGILSNFGPNSFEESLSACPRGYEYVKSTSGFSLAILTSQSGATRGYSGTGLVISNRGQMMRTTPELAPPLQTSAPHQLFLLVFMIWS
ncbi:hypothetical protein AVEN_248076-1 [Araneus ventricosus]|uniref:Uncharacterized protein n=1 Tax=Araneus ventricosus TaxID=182803 RepID=A0A4Y2MR42_ARAVE|nr:hypothetical protein AVEN_248076-1 [Araneus ventricosus]